MPHRRLVHIGETPALPTIAQFLTEMATRQHEEIQRLKREALEKGSLPDPKIDEGPHDELTPDPWLLHPVRVKRLKPKTSKRAKKSSSRTKKPAKAAKSPRPAKKSAGTRRRSKAVLSKRSSAKRR